jgi:23S rRNA (adenine2503-C2)-methyltransferase
MSQVSAYSLTSEDWKSVLADADQSPRTLRTWLKGLMHGADHWNGHISPDFIEKMKQKYSFDRPFISKTQKAEDGTIKFLVQFTDGMEVETVLIPFHKRYTVCVSTQVGCAMNCSFCYTGTQGLKRHLTADEIVGQYYLAFDFLKSHRLSDVKPSIVFMGQGEPLHNVAPVKKSVELFNDTLLYGVGVRQMTLSTVGYLPNLGELKNFPPINVALSLHSPFQDQRSELIPVNGKFALNDVLRSLDEKPLLPRQFITYEYILIQDFNMSDAHADELSTLLSHRSAIINLIPFNPYPGSAYKRPTSSEVESFQQKLVEKKLRVMLRKTKGDDILAACGQLKIKKLEKTYART